MPRSWRASSCWRKPRVCSPKPPAAPPSRCSRSWWSRGRSIRRRPPWLHHRQRLKTTEAVASAIGEPFLIEAQLDSFTSAWERAQALHRATGTRSADAPGTGCNASPVSLSPFRSSPSHSLLHGDPGPDPSPPAEFTSNEASVSVDAASVDDLLQALEGRFPGILARLCDENGKLRRFLNVYVNSEDIAPRQPVHRPPGRG